MKPLDKAIAVRRNWPFRSPNPDVAYGNRIRRARAILDLAESHGSRSVQFEARRLFIVSVCAAFESFWRDVIRDAIDEGGITLHSAPHLGKVTFTILDVREILGRELTLGELVAASYTFQSAEAVDHALSEVLGFKAFAEFGKDELLVEEVPRKNRSERHGPPLSTRVKGTTWLRHGPSVNRAFLIRHDTVHDTGTRHWPSSRTVFELDAAISTFCSTLKLFVVGRVLAATGKDVRVREQAVKRTRFTVEPKGDEWILRKGPEVISQHHTKAPAVQRGVQLGNATPNSQLLIKRQNGEFQEERTYGRDPFPPKV